MSGGCQPERMPKRMPEPMLGRMPERMPDRLSEYMSDKMPTRMPDGMSECVPERMPDRMSEYTSDRMRDIMSAYMPGRISVGFSWGITRRKSFCFLNDYRSLHTCSWLSQPIFVAPSRSYLKGSCAEPSRFRGIEVLVFFAVAVHCDLPGGRNR